MREAVIDRFPMPAGRQIDLDDYLAQMDAIYKEDAYHSLSIEAYRVNSALIYRVRSGEWKRDGFSSNALAARGYWQAFQTVKRSVAQVLQGAQSGEVTESSHHDWHRELQPF